MPCAHSTHARRDQLTWTLPSPVDRQVSAQFSSAPPRPPSCSLGISYVKHSGSISGVQPIHSGCCLLPTFLAQKALHRGWNLPRLWEVPPAQLLTRRASVLYLLPAARHVGSCHLGASRSKSLLGFLNSHPQLYQGPSVADAGRGQREFLWHWPPLTHRM